MPSVEPSWAEHVDVIVPGILLAFKSLIWLIGVLGAALIGVFIWLGKKIGNKIESMDSKLSSLHDAMLGCDGCRDSLEKYGRRASDSAFNEIK